MSEKQQAIIISAMTCSGKTTFAQGPQQRQQQQYRSVYKGPTVGVSEDGSEKTLYESRKSSVRLFHGFEVIDLSIKPYSLPPGRQSTHNFDRYKADILKLNAPNRIILVSTHDETRSLLCKMKWHYCLVYPNRVLKEAWMGRLRARDQNSTEPGLAQAYAKKINESFEPLVLGMAGMAGMAGMPTLEIKAGARRSMFFAKKTGQGQIGIYPGPSSSGVGSAGNGAAAAATSSSFPVDCMEIQHQDISLEDVARYIIQQQQQQQQQPPRLQPLTPVKPATRPSTPTAAKPNTLPRRPA